MSEAPESASTTKVEAPEGAVPDEATPAAAESSEAEPEPVAATTEDEPPAAVTTAESAAAAPEPAEDEDAADPGRGILSMWGQVSAFVIMSLIAITLITATRGDTVPEPTRAADMDLLWVKNPPREGLPVTPDAPNVAKTPSIVTRPPMPEGIFPCSECHEPDDDDIDLEIRDLELEHSEKNSFTHGNLEWCFDCHDVTQRDSLHLSGGQLIPFEDFQRLCAQCHGRIYTEWTLGIHGRRTGYWDGPRRASACTQCHDPHDPAFKAIEPMPPPIRAFQDRSQY